MTMKNILEIIAIYASVLFVSAPLGKYLYFVLEGKKTFMHAVFSWLEKITYKATGVDAGREQTWVEYAFSIAAVSVLGLVLLMCILLFQAYLPFNPQKLPGLKLGLAFNIAASFVTNTNWQSYVPEITVSYFSQMAGLAVQNFISAAVGISVAAALMRGISRKETQFIGNFWADLVRIIVYVLLPLSIISSVFLISQGVPQNFSEYTHAQTIEGAPQIIAQGPVASQEAIKLLGTNGGGFFNANSSHPFENPSPFTGFFEVFLLLVISAALIRAFGYYVRDEKQGSMLLYSVTAIAVVLTFFAVFQESRTSPVVVSQASGVVFQFNSEGKEMRFGPAQSAIFSVATTATSCGAVNNMHDSNNPLTGMVELFNMQSGELIFGGTGSGLYTLLLFAVLTVFAAGLMVGRTPEYIGKKIGSFDMQLTSVAVLFPSVVILVFTAFSVYVEQAAASVSNPGAHGFSQLLYANTSAAANNGSAFAGFNANTDYWNILLGVSMIIGRFVPMFFVIRLAASFASKKITPATSGTVATNDIIFAFMLAAVIVIVGGLTFFPALAIGPIAEHLQIFAGKG